MQTLLANPSKLKPNPWNTNKVTPENMAKLEKSIRDLGFVSAVVVRELPDGTLQILGGQHRVETAVAMGLKEVPCLNLGSVPDAKAKKIGLVDNARYGVDESIGLAKLLEDIGLSSTELAEFLPFTQQDFESITAAVNFNLDDLEMGIDEDEDLDVDVDDLKKATKPVKTHDVLRFRLPLGDAERVRQLVERTMKAESLHDDDELTAAGMALAILLLGSHTSHED